MAIDLQTLFNGLPVAGAQTGSDARNRAVGLLDRAPTQRFDHALKKAESSAQHEDARLLPPKPHALDKPKQWERAERPEAASRTAPAKKESSPRTTKPERADVSRAESERQNMPQSEKSASVEARSETEPTDPSVTEDEPNRNEAQPSAADHAAMPAPELLAAAAMTQPAPIEASVTSAAASNASAGGDKIEAATVAAAQPMVTPQPSQQASANPPAQPAAAAASVDASVRFAQTDQNAAMPQPPKTSVDMPPTVDAASKEQARPNEVTAPGESVMPPPTDAAQPATADAQQAVQMSVDTQIASQAAVKPTTEVREATSKAVQTDAAKPISTENSAAATRDLSGGQATLDQGRSFDQDAQSRSDGASGFHRMADVVAQTDAHAMKSPFQEQMNGGNASGSASPAGRAERSELGASTMTRAAAVESARDAQAAFPAAQSVTLDLDPLDLGPLRVRIMMSEQTVHAHIRTGHGELAQGLLQQGSSLDASLRTTGLEMGQLRVTVDQQSQQRGGDHAGMFSQQQGRPGSFSGGSASAGMDDERSTSAKARWNHDGRVSFFA